ncbi:phage tail tape measure protein [Roseovarius rhodophyticola]|uniref:Phage tail tape measure protein n=1 Tax=Roseovarius rhodophyticola TaxID=3080827 RepID=A0ABZ2TF58_9RHOB|nr:phage tail tape measure protein [Roseovarius sp. W115]MDV2928583.1 phage tail tape measure protein [Roseovarius sp. W115]
MAEIGGLDDLDAQIAALDENLGAASDMAAAFNTEMARVKLSFAGTGQDAARMERSFSRGLTKAMRSAVVDGDSLSDSLRNLANSMVNSVFNAAVRPVTNQVGGLISDGIGALVGNLLPFEKGGSFAQGRVQPFANGGVIGGPTTFPMRGGMGLMGEAGPEAIMPLARGADGKLGVRGGGGQPISVVMNVSTPDVEGFRRSQAQIAAQLGRVIGRGNRNR